MRYLIVVDMQKDFVTGVLGTKEARQILPAVVARVQGFEGRVIFTRDTHGEDYLETAEGKKLPVVHCVKGTEGWQLHPQIEALAEPSHIIDKPSFGSLELMELLKQENEKETRSSFGSCNDVCILCQCLRSYFQRCI